MGPSIGLYAWQCAEIGCSLMALFAAVKILRHGEHIPFRLKIGLSIVCAILGVAAGMNMGWHVFSGVVLLIAACVALLSALRTDDVRDWSGGRS